MLLLAEAEEALDRRVSVGAVFPLAAGPPGKFRRFGCVAERLARAEQRFYIDAIIDRGFARRHLITPCWM